MIILGSLIVICGTAVGSVEHYLNKSPVCFKALLSETLETAPTAWIVNDCQGLSSMQAANHQSRY